MQRESFGVFRTAATAGLVLAAISVASNNADAGTRVTHPRESASVLPVRRAGSDPHGSNAAGPSGSSTFQVTYNGQSFSYSLPPSSIATFTWQPGSSTVSAWETETSRGKLVKKIKLAQQPNLTYGTSNTSLPTVTVNPSVTMQTISGFGGAMTQSAAELINNSNSEKKVMDALFGASGADFNIVRVPVGASDFATGPIYQGGTSYSYDDNGGHVDPTLAHFSIGTRTTKGAKAKACAPAPKSGEYGTGDYSDTIPALLCAKEINPSLNLLAVPWSAPGWMKIDDATVPQICSGSDDFLQSSQYGTYAYYFLKFLLAYQMASLPVSEVSMQNEPENCNTTYPTMEMAPSDQATFATDLQGEFDGLDTGLSQIPTIMAYDHNYLDNSNPPWSAPANQITDYPETVIQDASGTNSPVGLVGFHHYTGDLAQEEAALDEEHTTYGNIPIWMTEATGTRGSTTPAQNLVWEGQHDLMEPLQNWVGASLYLNLALNSSGGPHKGGCGDGSSPCRGMVTMNSKGYTPNEDYYDWAQFSKFVHPGATHICSDTISLPSTVNTCTLANPGAPTNGSPMIDTVAFQNNDNSFVLVAMNTTPDGAGTGSCEGSGSVSSLASGTKVIAYVPKGNWSNQGNDTGIDVVNVEGANITNTLIPTAEAINSCASNSITGQTVCVGNGNDVYVLKGTELDPSVSPNPLMDGATGAISFSGGSVATSGVSMDSTDNKALIALSVGGVGGFQFLDLARHTFEPPFQTMDPSGHVSEDPLIDPVHQLILSASEDNNFEAVNVSNSTSPQFFENPISGVSGYFDSTSEDCSTGIVLAPAEESTPSQVAVADIENPGAAPAAEFTPGSPGSWTAPEQVQTLTGSNLSAGGSGSAVAQGTHTGVIAGEFGGDGLTALALPTTSGNGVTPAINDWVSCEIGNAFSMGDDPHTLAAYQSPSGGDAIALLANEGATELIRVDLTEMLNPAEVSATGNVCNSTTLPSSVETLIPLP